MRRGEKGKVKGSLCRRSGERGRSLPLLVHYARRTPPEQRKKSQYHSWEITALRADTPENQHAGAGAETHHPTFGPSPGHFHFRAPAYVHAPLPCQAPSPFQGPSQVPSRRLAFPSLHQMRRQCSSSQSPYRGSIPGGAGASTTTPSLPHPPRTTPATKARPCACACAYAYSVVVRGGSRVL